MVGNKQDKSPLQKPVEKWAEGRPLSSRKLNQAVDTINAITGKIAAPRQVVHPPKNPIIARRYSLTANYGDYFEAKEILAGPKLSEVITRIAKDWWVQRTPFDGETFNGISYTYSSDSERVGNDGASIETQVVVPPYVEGVEILVIQMPQGSGVTIDVDGEDVELKHMELNGGRSWAKKST